MAVNVLTTLSTDNKLVMFLTSLHCTFMLHTQRGCLNSRTQDCEFLTR